MCPSDTSSLSLLFLLQAVERRRISSVARMAVRQHIQTVCPSRFPMGIPISQTMNAWSLWDRKMSPTLTVQWVSWIDNRYLLVRLNMHPSLASSSLLHQLILPAPHLALTPTLTPLLPSLHLSTSPPLSPPQPAPSFLSHMPSINSLLSLTHGFTFLFIYTTSRYPLSPTL